MKKTTFFIFAIITLISCDPPTDPPQIIAVAPWSPIEYFENIEPLPTPLAQLDTMPELDRQNWAIVTPETVIEYPGIFEDPEILNYLVSGDFTEFGRIELNSTLDQRKVIKGKADPFLSTENVAKFSAFDVRSGSWVFSDLLFDDPSLEKEGVKYGPNSRLIGPAGNTTWNRCLWRNILTGVRVINSSNNTFQLCAGQRGTALVPTDGVLVGFEASEGQESAHNRVLLCESENLPDGCVATPWSASASQSGSTPGTVVAFCSNRKTFEIYRPTEVAGKDALYQWCSYMAEDGGDFKNGPVDDKPENRCWYYGNVSYGHLPTAQNCDGRPCASAGSSGAGIGVWHNRARNWNIYGNLSLSDIHGIFVKQYLPNDPRHRVENIDVAFNVVAYQTDCHPGGIEGGPNGGRINENNGLAFRVMCETCTVRNNVVYGSKTAFFNPTPAQFKENLFADDLPKDSLRFKIVTVNLSPLLWPGTSMQIELPGPEQ